jgi:hypothetical protein
MLSKRKKTAQTLDDSKGKPLPEVYDSFLQDLKDRIRTAQSRAALSVNRGNWSYSTGVSVATY